MTNNAQSSPASSSSAAPGMRGDIQTKWSKFSAAEVAAITSTDDLVTKVQSKYSIDKAQAQRDVDTFAKGRQL